MQKIMEEQRQGFRTIKMKKGKNSGRDERCQGRKHDKKRKKAKKKGR